MKFKPVILGPRPELSVLQKIQFLKNACDNLIISQGYLNRQIMELKTELRQTKDLLIKHLYPDVPPPPEENKESSEKPD